MGRQSKFKQAGGGSLNGVDGTITGYKFTTEFPFASKSGTKSKSAFNSLFNVLSIRVDGADVDIKKPLFTGDADQFEISDDGHTLTPIEDGYVLNGGNPNAKFIASWEKASEVGASSDD